MANRKTRTEEPCFRLPLSKRTMWSSSSDEDENISVSRIRAAARRNPSRDGPPMDGEIAYSLSSSSDEERMTRTQACKNNSPTSPTPLTSSERFIRNRVDAVDQAIGKDTSFLHSFL